MKTKTIFAVVIVSAVLAIPLMLKSSRAKGPAQSSTVAVQKPATSSNGLPRFVGLGSTTCAPCKVMLGVMSELEQKYVGAMVIEFINAEQYPEQAERYGIRIIPSQIFYGPDGRELYRHTGVIRTEEIVAKWAELGFPFTHFAGR